LQLVRNGKDELARIRVENIIREEEMSQAYELIDLFCEKLQTRLDLLESHEHCPDELLECLHTIIYCGGLISEITELSQINGQFARKYGSDYVSDILLNGSPFVNGQVKYKLTIKQPDHHFVEKYLLGIVGPVDSSIFTIMKIITWQELPTILKIMSHLPTCNQTEVQIFPLIIWCHQQILKYLINQKVTSQMIVNKTQLWTWMI